MKSNRALTIATLAIIGAALVTVAGCKTGGMAMTTRGQLLKINIEHPVDLPDQYEDNVNIVLGNRGVNSMRDILIDVDVPPQLVVVDETHERGVTMTHDPGSSSYHYTLGNLQVAEDSTIHYKVRGSFAGADSASVKATAWQRDLTGDRLVQTAVIKLRRP